ncbi:MAG: DUF2911 domain-containing protein [Cyclobacteriaceae bacterium]
MKKIGYLVLTLIAAVLTVDVFAQIQTPAPSPGARVEQQVGVNNFSIDYSRPGVKGRELFVDVEAWGQTWRTGANAGTFLEFDADATFGGNKVPAGRYLVFTIPGKENWTWMLYGDLTLGGNVAGYDEANEVARWTSPTKTWDTNVENMAFVFSNVKDNSTDIGLYWGKYYTTFTASVDTDSQVMASIDQAMENPLARVGGQYAQAANYYYQNDKDLNKALEWINEAIKINSNAFWNIHTKAQIQAKMGDYKGAIATAQMSMDKAKANEAGDFGYIKRNEDALAMWKSKK